MIAIIQNPDEEKMLVQEKRFLLWKIKRKIGELIDAEVEELERSVGWITSKKKK